MGPGLEIFLSQSRDVAESQAALYGTGLSVNVYKVVNPCTLLGILLEIHPSLAFGGGSYWKYIQSQLLEEPGMEGRALCSAPLPRVGVFAWTCWARHGTDKGSVMLVPSPTDAPERVLAVVCVLLGRHHGCFGSVTGLEASAAW